MLDGDTAHPILLDGNFDEDWGDSLALTSVLHHAPRAQHTVTITALPSTASDPTPFYLLSLILA